MEIWEIKKITIVNMNWIKEYEVWEKDIEDINDVSIEYENSLHLLYEIKDTWWNTVARIENCPVIIEYKYK